MLYRGDQETPALQYLQGSRLRGIAAVSGVGGREYAGALDRQDPLPPLQGHQGGASMTPEHVLTIVELACYRVSERMEKRNTQHDAELGRVVRAIGEEIAAILRDHNKAEPA